MQPVKTAGANVVYRGPTIDIGDVWVTRDVVAQPGLGQVPVVYVDFVPTEAERAAIARGKGVIRLGILGMEPIPPVSLEVRPDIEVVSTEPPIIAEDRPPKPPPPPAERQYG